MKYQVILLQIIVAYSSKVQLRSAVGRSNWFKAFSKWSGHSCINCSMSGNFWLWNRLDEVELPDVTSWRWRMFSIQDSISFCEFAVLVALPTSRVILTSFETARSWRFSKVESDCDLVLGSSKTANPKVSSILSGLGIYVKLILELIEKIQIK